MGHFLRAQNKKYRCPSGTRVTGAHAKGTPSARTSYVSASTVITGNASFNGISRFVIPRHPFTATSRFVTPYPVEIPRSIDVPLTNAQLARPRARPIAPNIGRIITGWGVGIDAFGSPICEHAITPPFNTISGFAPKNAGFHSTKSANFPTSMLPTKCEIPCATAGQIVYFATYRRIRKLSSPCPSSSASAPRCCFILSAVCHVRVITSPTRPIACESDEIIEIAPKSCRISSAAIVSPRIRDSANATSSGKFLSR